MLQRLGIETRERWLFGWSTAALFCVGWADVSLKNVAETLFLKRVGVEQLPLVFLANSLLLVVSTAAVGRMASAVRDPVRLLPLALAALALLLLPLSIAVVVGMPGTIAALVIISKQISALALLVFFIALGELLDGRQAKRLFSPLTAGLTLGIIAGSFASEPLGRELGIIALLPASGVALLLAALCAAALLPRRRHALQPTPPIAHTNADSGPGLRELWRESRLFRLLFVTALCGGLLAPMLYYQFSYVADLATEGPRSEQRLLAFYARFRGWIHMAVFVAQLGIAARLYRWIGVPLAAAISPLVYLGGFAGLSFRLSLPAGVAAMSVSKVQDNAVFDSAVRILVDLLPDAQRANAMALLEGPIKRAGGALGNILVLGVVGVGTAAWVGWLAMPISVVWLAVALFLWRAYPSLLLGVAGQSGDLRKRRVDVAMLNATTLRKLLPHLRDPARCETAVELVSEAPPELAAATLASAAREAPKSIRPLLIASLDTVLERDPSNVPKNANAARDLAALLERPDGLDERGRADAVQAVSRLCPKSEARLFDELLERALGDASPAVQLAGVAARQRRHGADDAVLFDEIARAIRSEDGALRRTAREELRGRLLELRSGRDDTARPWLELLAELLECAEADRAETAAAFADVASHGGVAMADVAERVLAFRDSPDPRVRAALLRFVGHAGLSQHARWLVTQLAEGGEGGSQTRDAAREGLQALGKEATQAHAG